jgi:hypothetical protein
MHVHSFAEGMLLGAGVVAGIDYFKRGLPMTGTWMFGCVVFTAITFYGGF